MTHEDTRAALRMSLKYRKRIEELERELKCVEDRYKQQQDMACRYFDEVTALHNQAEMNGRLLTENAELRERILELKGALEKVDD